MNTCPNCNERWPSDMLQGEGCPACTLTETAQEDGLYDCCPECGASLAECHIGDAACSECVIPAAKGGVMDEYWSPCIAHGGKDNSGRCRSCEEDQSILMAGRRPDGKSEWQAKDDEINRLTAERDKQSSKPEDLQRIDELERELAEARKVLELAIGVPDNTIEIMRQEGLTIDNTEDPMQKLAFTIHTESCEVAGKAEALLDQWPAEGGEE